MSAPPILGVEPLGTITGIVAGPPPSFPVAAPLPGFSHRVERYELQAAARRLLPEERLRVCLLQPAPLARPELRYSPARSAAHMAGLMVCGSPWFCPVCASRVSERRRVEVARAVAWVEASGAQMVLTTFTLRHQDCHSLKASLGALLGAYRRMHQQREYRALRASYGLTHSIKAVEVTWSPRNGFHPHLHVLQVLPGGVELRRYGSAVSAAWRSALEHFGFSASAAVGVDVRASWEDVKDYVTKLGRTWGAPEELTKANTKRGRKDSLTPWDLLRSVRDTGDEVHAERFREFARTMKGSHQLQWSRFLDEDGKRRSWKKLCGVEDRSDEDLAANWLDDDRLAYALAWLDSTDWAAVKYGGPRAVAQLESIGSQHDRAGVAAFLAECRARYFAEGWGL